MSQDRAAPGWSAIRAAMERLHPGQQPRHVGYVTASSGEPSLHGSSAYAAPDHWHYVTLGLSELFAKSPDTDPAISGWGFELTMRVVRSPHQTDAPGWPFTLLGRLADETRSRGVLFLPGHRHDLSEPITGGDPPTALTALAVADTPEPATLATRNGRVSFRQLVGITREELELMKVLSTDAVLEGLRRSNPLLITDPERATTA